MSQEVVRLNAGINFDDVGNVTIDSARFVAAIDNQSAKNSMALAMLPTLFLPGPEDVVAGAVLATKVGQKIAEVVLVNGQKVWKYLDGTTARVGSQEAQAIARAKLVNNSRRDDAQQFVNNNAPIQVPNTVTRNDNDFSSTVNHRGNPKAHIDGSGNLVSANPNGTGSPTAHVSGSNPGNTPYISTTDAASVDPTLGGPKTYGSQQTTVNSRDLQRDINSGAVSQDIKIINNQQLVNQLQNKTGEAQRKFDANPSDRNSRDLTNAQRDLDAAKRDGEILITPRIPPSYYTKPIGPATPIVPTPNAPKASAKPAKSTE